MSVTVAEASWLRRGERWKGLILALAALLAGCTEHALHPEGSSVGREAGIGDEVAGIGDKDAGAPDAAFAEDFAARASAALAVGAPPWTCATALPTMPVADATAARAVIRQFVANVLGVPAVEVAEEDHGPCGSNLPETCANWFAHDCAKSGGSIYDTVVPLAADLEAHATSVEETIWGPMNMSGNPVMSGISEGLLIGMIVFNHVVACR